MTGGTQPPTRGAWGPFFLLASPSLPAARWGRPFFPDASKRVPPRPGKIPWRKTWQPTPVFLPEEPHGQRSLWAIVHRVAKSRTQLKQLSTHAQMKIEIL